MLDVTQRPDGGAGTTPATVFDNILCGIDSSPEALEAARQAGRLRAPDGRVRLAAVAEVNVAVHAGFAMSHVLEELDASTRDALHRAIDTVRPDSTHLLAGDPVPTLLCEIRETGATLVAVGPHGHSRALGILMGGVAASLLHEAPCSVLLARPARFGPFPSSIIAGVDGSEQSFAAAAAARSIAERFGSELVVVAATGGKPADLDAVEALGLDVAVDSRRPVDALVELGEEADLLVLGSRGLHGLASLGSVSERVANRAPCSVLVVRDHT